MTSRVRAIALLMLLLLVGLSWSCGRKEDGPAPRAATPPASPSPAPPPASPAPMGSAPVGAVAAPPATAAGPGSTECCETVVDPLVGGYGNQILDLIPGTYDVEVSRKRILGVPIQPAHDTRIRVGVLRVIAGANTRVDLLDAKDDRALTGGFGSQEFGLPVGPIQIKVAGQAKTVTIKDGQITEF